MNGFDRIMLLVILLFSWAAHYDAQEAHRHTHELGCALSYTALCDWHSP